MLKLTVKSWCVELRIGVLSLAHWGLYDEPSIIADSRFAPSQWETVYVGQ